MAETARAIEADAPLPDRAPSLALAAARVSIALLVACAVFPPFIPVAGPLSADDLLAVAGVALAVFLSVFAGRPPSVDATILGLVALALLGFVSSIANAESVGDLVRLAGRSSGRMLFYAALVAAVRLAFDGRVWARRALAIVVAAASAEALFCLWAYVTRYQGPYGLGVIPFPDWSVLYGGVRVQGTFSGAVGTYETDATSANFLAGYLVFTIPATLGLAAGARRGEVRVLVLLGALAQLAALYLTYTRAALVALGAPILVAGWLIGRRKLAAGALVLAVAATLAIPSVRTKFFGEAHNRFALWGASLMITRDAPLTGIGDGNYDTVLHGRQEYFDTPWGIASTSSHNSVLLSAAYHGVPGGVAHVVLYALVVAVVLAAVRRVRDRGGPGDLAIAVGIAAGISGYLVHDQFNNLFYVPKVITQLWLLFGVLLALAPRVVARELTTPASSGSTGAAPSERRMERSATHTEDEALVGVRALELALGNLPLIAVLALVGAAAGWVSAVLVERPFVTRAVVELGIRHPLAPVEDPIVAAERLGGHVADAARRHDAHALVVAEPRRDMARALTRYLDVTVTAKTASAAQTIAAEGLAAFMAEHVEMSAFERRLVTVEGDNWKAWVARVEAQRARVVAEPKSDDTDERLTELDAAMLDAKTRVNACDALDNDLRTPATRIAVPPSDPAQVPSTAKPRAAGGLALGLFVAALALVAKHARAA
ncbi:O-antigen ligase family protein [Myxococcota bacterium]|nr:O-antigen ligase family protein [Myxococcota bacterium]